MLVKLLISICLLPGIYQYNLPLLNGGNIALSAYQGKKIMIVTLPVVQDAESDAWLFSLDSLAAAHLDSLAVVGVPAFEDGYTGSNKAALSAWYHAKLSGHVLVSDGLYTQSGSGEQQNGLFSWLTHPELNGTFSIEPQSPGYKFLVSSQGTLYAVLRPKTRLGSLVIDKLLHQ